MRKFTPETYKIRLVRMLKNRKHPCNHCPMKPNYHVAKNARSLVHVWGDRECCEFCRSFVDIDCISIKKSSNYRGNYLLPCPCSYYGTKAIEIATKKLIEEGYM